MEKVPSAPATATPPGFLHHGARKAGLPAYTGDGAGNPAATEHTMGTMERPTPPRYRSRDRRVATRWLGVHACQSKGMGLRWGQRPSRASPQRGLSRGKTGSSQRQHYRAETHQDDPEPVFENRPLPQEQHGDRPPARRWTYRWEAAFDARPSAPRSSRPTRRTSPAPSTRKVVSDAARTD